MKNNIDFESDDEIVRLKKKALKVSPADMNIEEFFLPHNSPYALRNMADDYLRRRNALRICADLHTRRIKLQREQDKKEALRIEQLIHGVARNVRLFEGEDDDNGSLRDYLLNRFVNYGALVGVEDWRLALAFSEPALYLEVDKSARAWPLAPDYWVRLVGMYSEPPA
jgi:hypothetical protein